MASSVSVASFVKGNCQRLVNNSRDRQLAKVTERFSLARFRSPRRARSFGIYAQQVLLDLEKKARI